MIYYYYFHHTLLLVNIKVNFHKQQKKMLVVFSRIEGLLLFIYLHLLHFRNLGRETENPKVKKLKTNVK